VGIAALRKVLDPQPVELSHFARKTVAVDADNLLWSFVTAFGARGEQPAGPDGRPIGHAIGLAGRLKLYAQHGIRSAWVFDGPQPLLKEATLAGRAARILASGSIELTLAQIAEAKELMSALGVPWMEAPMESDAQCAHFVRSGLAYAAITQDYDIALHGAPRAGRNLTGSDTRRPELLDLEVSLRAAGLSREQLVDVAILIGTDYNEGFPGVGPVKAVKLVQKHGDLHAALAALGASLPQADEIRALFLAHPVDASAAPRWIAPKPDAVRALFDGWGLSRQRADDLVAALTPVHAASQAKLF
jgi:flap endonuclease-1